MGALKYASNSSLGINAGEVERDGGYWGKMLMSQVSATGFFSWEIGWSPGMSTLAKGFIDTPAARGGYQTTG